MIELPISTLVGFGIVAIMAFIGVQSYTSMLKACIHELEKKSQNSPADAYFADTDSTFVKENWGDMPADM